MRTDDNERITEPRAPGRGVARPALFALLALALVAVTTLAVRELLRATPTPGAIPAAPGSGSAASAPATPAATTPDAAQAAPAEPMPPAGPAAPPLPALAQSDVEVRTTLAEIIPAPAHASLAPDNLLARAAALADGFARGRLVRDKLPLPAVPGKLIVVERGERIFLDTANHGLSIRPGLELRGRVRRQARKGDPVVSGGRQEDRTPDLRVANAALSQLS